MLITFGESLYFQIRSHSQVPGVRTSSDLLGGHNSIHKRYSDFNIKKSTLNNKLVNVSSGLSDQQSGFASFTVPIEASASSFVEFLAHGLTSPKQMGSLQYNKLSLRSTFG